VGATKHNQGRLNLLNPQSTGQIERLLRRSKQSGLTARPKQ
jgi:hypothetical protein